MPAAELNKDATNWWVPNVRALESLALASGFGRVELVDGPTPLPPTELGTLHRCRVTIHAWK